MSEELLAYAGLALSCFAKVFLAGIQTKNVQHSRYGMLLVTSMAMSVADAWMIRKLAADETMGALVVVMIANTLGMVSAIITTTVCVIGQKRARPLGGASDRYREA